MEFWENAYKLDPPRTFYMYWKERFEKDGEDVVFMSAMSKDDVTTLRGLLYERVKELHIKRYPYNKFLY